MSGRTMMVVVGLFLAAPIAFAQTPEDRRPPVAEGDRLPVRRVVLYKSGVGYFEHLGRVRDTQSVTITFTSAQLDDALKSLTMLDLGSGRVTSVSYGSDAPLAQRLGSLRLPLGERTSLPDFYGSLRGARFEVISAGATLATGRLLSVERRSETVGDRTTMIDELSLVTDGGEIRLVELSPRISIRILERDLREQVARYLGLLASVHAQDTRRMVIATAGAGERDLFVSYVSEVPIWKTTYRVVLPSGTGETPLLQGWAIVDNTVGEDWDRVELSLVAGAPQSFVQQISQPYYARRPVVPLPERASLTPQTHLPTMTTGTGRIAGQVRDPGGAALPGTRVSLSDARGVRIAETVTDAQGRYEVSAVPAGTYTLEFQLSGFGTDRGEGIQITGGMSIERTAVLWPGPATERVRVAAEAPALRADVVGGVVGGTVAGLPEAPPPASDIAQRMAEMQPAAVAGDLGDLFEYTLREPVTIRTNESAMLPIVNAQVGVERVSLWNEAMGGAQPLRALWLTNTSGLTLDGGSFTVLEEEAFAGEGLLEPIKPGEKRLLSYAADLGVRVQRRSDRAPRRVSRVLVRSGVLIQYRDERERRTYAIRNEDRSPRTIIIEHPVREGWTTSADGPEPAETTTTARRYRVVVEPNAETTLVVEETRPLETRVAVTQLTDEQVSLFMRDGSISAEVEQALRPILAKKGEIARLTADISTRAEETSRIANDQQRIRENMKALRGSDEERALLQRYTRQLDQQEDRLAALRQETSGLTERRRAAQAEIDRLVEALALDVTLGGR